MIANLIYLCLFSAVVLLALALAAWVADREPTPARPDRRLSAREMELTGDDYRDHVAGYFRKVSARREIVRDITGAS
jgi:hypothetical protein